MSEWFKVLQEKELKNSHKVVLKGKSLALFRLNRDIYALEDTCSHEEASLAEGEIIEDEVYCPKHGSRFSIRTGQVRSLPAIRGVNSYPTKIERGNIYIKMP